MGTAAARKSWDTSIPGKHPALTREVTPAEIARAKQEAILLMNSRGAEMMSQDQVWLAHQMMRAEAHQANVELFTQLGDTKQADQHRAELIDAMVKLGRFDDVQAYLLDQGDEALTDQVKQVRNAVERDDEDVCECEPDVVQVGHPIVENDRKTYIVSLKTHSSIGPIFSEKHGKVVLLWRCRHCGDLNAHDHIPEGHERILELRNLADIEAHRINATARTWKPDTNTGDHILLAVEPCPQC